MLYEALAQNHQMQAFELWYRSFREWTPTDVIGETSGWAQRNLVPLITRGFS